MSKHLLKPLLIVAISVCLASGLFATLSPVKTAHASCDLGRDHSWAPGGLDLNNVFTTVDNRTCSGVYLELLYQMDGNFVLYRMPYWPYTSGETALWATGTEHTSVGHVIFQGDGNLVVYDGSGQARWASNTNGLGATLLYFQKDGNLVIYRDNTPLWATNTCCQA
jgi:hypothetical protein